MDALEIAKQVNKHNIIDIAIGVSALTPLLQERSSKLIKERLADLFEGLDRISSDQDFSKMHRGFCQWFVKSIRLAKTAEPSSYAHAAKVIDFNMMTLCGDK